MLNGHFYKHSGFYISLIAIFFLLLPVGAKGDVVKPALIEISVSSEGTLQMEIRASLEAVMTGINSQFKDTTQSPNGAAYDELRVLESPEFRLKFMKFAPKFLAGIKLKTDAETLPLVFQQIIIPPKGYTKVPRISTVYLKGNIPRSAQELELVYPQTFSDFAVRVRQNDVSKNKWFWSDWRWIRGKDTSGSFSLSEVFYQPSWTQLFTNYVNIGFWHIFPKGLDHILFILGIFFFSTKWSLLLAQVTMFTVAHTLTLGLSAAGLISIPEWIAQPLIALSIAYIGFENIAGKSDQKFRLALVFFFGLLHGVGFAEALRDFNMDTSSFLIALVSFNIGVEIGQIFILLCAFMMFAFWFAHRKDMYKYYIAWPISFLIGLVGAFWTLERVGLF